MTLITEHYREQNAEMHRIKPQYGNAGHKAMKSVAVLVDAFKARSVLDYGCGKATLADALKLLTPVRVRNYDPAFPEYASPPEPADLVVCRDVMEHIEPECLDAVIADIHRLTLKGALLEISNVPAQKHLPDGRNAHLIVEPPEWWVDKFTAFNIIDQIVGKHHLMLVLTP